MGLITFYFLLQSNIDYQGSNSQTACQDSKQGRPWSDVSLEAVWSGSALFAYAFGKQPVIGSCVTCEARITHRDHDSGVVVVVIVDDVVVVVLRGVTLLVSGR